MAAATAVKAVSNASPLITLARIGKLDSLPRLFRSVYIPTAVYDEVVVAGAGLPGAAAVAKAEWLQVKPILGGKVPMVTGLGAGEISAVLLAKEIGADIVLMDERRGRRLASESGLAVIGCVGILEELYRRSELHGLRHTYEEMSRQGVRIDIRTLQGSLQHFGLRAL